MPSGDATTRFELVRALLIPSWGGRGVRRARSLPARAGEGRPEPCYSGCQSSTLFPSQSLIQANRP
jgi:hypothetical protein